MESPRVTNQLSEPQAIQVLSREWEALELYWWEALYKYKVLAKRWRLSKHWLVPGLDQLLLGRTSTVPLSVSRSNGDVTDLRISFPLLLNDLTQQCKGILKHLFYSLYKVFISFLITDLFPQASSLSFLNNVLYNFLLQQTDTETMATLTLC